MGENNANITFVNCIGSDVDLWKKGPNDMFFQWETCLLFDEPEYNFDNSTDINSTWKFVDHNTKRYLLGNGKNIFHYEKYDGCSLIRVEITTPLYSLKELCTYTIATRLLVNNSAMEINTFEVPNELKTDLNNCIDDLIVMYEKDGDSFINDWTISHEEEYNSQINIF